MKLLILSDIHGNWPALQSVLDAESDSDEILCLGDLVDYGPDPAACVAWAMQASGRSRIIQGNHDWGVASKKDPRSSPPFRHLTTCTKAFSLQALSEEMLQFLRTLKPIDTFQMLGKHCVACHAAPSDPLFRYLRTTDKDLEYEITVAGSPDFLFFGHTHWPLLKRIRKTTVVNPGSVGQPKDGDTRAPYAVWEDGKVDLRRVAYPIEATVEAYARTPLTASDVASLIAVLRTGGTLPATTGAADLAIRR